MEMVDLEAGVTASESNHFTVIRNTAFVERLYYLQHRLGIFSNVLVSASYECLSEPRSPAQQSSSSSSTNKRLSKGSVYSALRSVIKTYPELGFVPVPEIDHSRKGRGRRHNLSMAILHTINLDRCVEFRDDDSNGECHNAGAELFEKIHAEWTWTRSTPEPGVPWWKVLVLNGRDVVFVFHHNIGDGIFGPMFHRAFLAALNSRTKIETEAETTPPSRESSATESIINLDPTAAIMEPHLKDWWLAKASWADKIPSIFLVLHFFWVRLLFSSRLFFVGNPKPSPIPAFNMQAGPPEEYTRTGVVGHRISAAKMRQFVASCRANGTTFTALLVVAVAAVLAKNEYPEAKIGFIRHAVNMRPVLPLGPPSPKDEKDLAGAPSGKGQRGLVMCAGAEGTIRRLRKYREAFYPESDPTSSSSVLPSSSSTTSTTSLYTSKREKSKDAKMTHEVQARAVWKLARAQADFHKRSRAQAATTHRVGNSLGPHLEDVMERVFPLTALTLGNAVLVSNIGAVSGEPVSKPEGEGPQQWQPWRIRDMQFSTGVARGSVSFNGIVFNLIGVDGGDTVVNAAYEKGIISDAMPRRVMVAALERMEYFCKHEQ